MVAQHYDRLGIEVYRPAALFALRSPEDESTFPVGFVLLSDPNTSRILLISFEVDVLPPQHGSFAAT